MQCKWIYNLLHLYIPPKDATNEKIASLLNEVLTMVNEYQLTSSVHHANLVSPIVPDSLERQLRPLSYYTREGTGGVKSMDIREYEIALTLRVTTLFHWIDMRHDFGRVAPDSLDKEQHYEGDLLWFLLSCRNCPVTFDMVVAQVVWENEKEMTEEAAENCASSIEHRATRKALLNEYKKACAAYDEFNQGREGHNKERAWKLRRKRDAKYARLNDTRKDVRECKWKELYLQAFLDKDSLEEFERIRSLDDPPDSDDSTDSESSNSSHGVTSSRSSSLSEGNTLEVEVEGTPAGEADSGAQVEAPDAAKEDTAMDEDFCGDAMGNVPPLSPATNEDSDLLDLMEQADTHPPATPTGVTDSMSSLQIDSPHSEVEAAEQQGQ